MRKRLLLSSIIFLSIFGCGGGGSEDSGDSNPSCNDSIIKNTIIENTTPVGLSTFAMGVPIKFPLEDDLVNNTPGYKSIARVVRNIATNELYTFPEPASHIQIADTIKYFIDSGHLVTHEIHILNGPSMRKCRDPWTNTTFGHSTCDDEFVSSLQSDSSTRDAVKILFKEVVEYAKSLELLGATVLICPELEDNETHETFQILLNILNKVGWTDPTKIVRNAGFPGEFLGVRYETHDDTEVSNLRPGDIVNNDGNSFIYVDETANNGELPENRIRYMLERAQERGIIAFLWSSELQGNVQVSPGNFIPYPSYTNRTYKLHNTIGLASILLGINIEEVIINIEK